MASFEYRSSSFCFFGMVSLWTLRAYRNHDATFKSRQWIQVRLGSIKQGINNGFRILTYLGENVEENKLDVLFEATWLPVPEGTFQDRPVSPDKRTKSAFFMTATFILLQFPTYRKMKIPQQLMCRPIYVDVKLQQLPHRLVWANPMIKEDEFLKINGLEFREVHSFQNLLRKTQRNEQGNASLQPKIQKHRIKMKRKKPSLLLKPLSNHHRYKMKISKEFEI